LLSNAESYTSGGIIPHTNIGWRTADWEAAVQETAWGSDYTELASMCPCGIED